MFVTGLPEYEGSLPASLVTSLDCPWNYIKNPIVLPAIDHELELGASIVVAAVTTDGTSPIAGHRIGHL
jgi:hypothetical protein